MCLKHSLLIECESTSRHFQPQDGDSEIFVDLRLPSSNSYTDPQQPGNERIRETWIRRKFTESIHRFVLITQLIYSGYSAWCLARSRWPSSEYIGTRGSRGKICWVGHPALLYQLLARLGQAGARLGHRRNCDLWSSWLKQAPDHSHRARTGQGSFYVETLC